MEQAFLLFSVYLYLSLSYPSHAQHRGNKNVLLTNATTFRRCRVKDLNDLIWCRCVRYIVNIGDQQLVKVGGYINWTINNHSHLRYLRNRTFTKNPQGSLFTRTSPYVHRNLHYGHMTRFRRDLFYHNWVPYTGNMTSVPGNWPLDSITTWLALHASKGILYHTTNVPVITIPGYPAKRALSAMRKHGG